MATLTPVSHILNWGDWTSGFFKTPLVILTGDQIWKPLGQGWHEGAEEMGPEKPPDL